jgi:hypothetical protein
VLAHTQSNNQMTIKTAIFDRIGIFIYSFVKVRANPHPRLVGGGAGVEEVYAGVRVQRLRLRFDLGVGEWG